ncbi:DUF4142 domain-containing protein [Sphingobium estronivorans]|uniref:DUF4142 domain-containing protein n=1 Tax=Sphingobium estronivorans TaxID=1577690 RepID=UPI00123A5BD2|nr:DUF4142 domain-containing protein [Sphingobium estronivorans]
MKVKSSILALALTGLVLGGCNKKSETPANDVAVGPVNSVNTLDPASVAESPGQSFANAAAASDTFEVESSKLAVINSQSVSVKRFAETMIKAHTDSTAKLTQAASSAASPIVPQPMLTTEQRQTLDMLKGKKGADFDAAYVQAQIKGHRETLEKLKAYSATGDVPTLKDFATKLVPIVVGHLNMAESLKS